MLGYWGLLSYIGATLYCHSMYMQAGHVQCLLALVLLTPLQLPVNNTLNPYNPPPLPFPEIQTMVERWILIGVKQNGAGYQTVW